jgi:hypothetical protein
VEDIPSAQAPLPPARARWTPSRIVFGLLTIAVIGLGLRWLWPTSEEPVAQAPVAPAAPAPVVDVLPDSEVVIVIDDTASMDDKRPKVYAWYLAEVKRLGGKVTNVVLFGGAGIRHSRPETVEFKSVGSAENIRAALESANMANPTAKVIILIADEPGDDWGDWKLNLPPVIAHSLDLDADAALEYLAKITKGRFVGSKEVLARR